MSALQNDAADLPYVVPKPIYDYLRRQMKKQNDFLGAELARHVLDPDNPTMKFRGVPVVVDQQEDIERKVARRRAEKAKYIGFRSQAEADRHEAAWWATSERSDPALSVTPHDEQGVLEKNGVFRFNLPFPPGKWLGKLIAAVSRVLRADFPQI